jgi:hypothetical protein
MRQWNHDQKAKVVPMAEYDVAPDTARELLIAAEAGREHGDTIAGRSWLGPVLSVFIGVLMGGFLLASVYLAPTATAGVWLLVVAGYVAGILISVFAYNVKRKVTSIGWLKRYQKGLAISCGVFFVALSVSFLVAERSPILWVPLAIATVIPIAVFGMKRPAR